MAIEDRALDDEHALRYARAELPAFRMPTPPHMHVPPPLTNKQVMATYERNHIGVIRGSVDPASDVSFLNQIDLPGAIRIQQMLEWKYEHRRKAQMILPFLHLGPAQAAKDVNFLRTEGITMVLAIRHRSMFPAPQLRGTLRVAEEQGIDTYAVDVLSNQELIAAFPIATEVINRHLVNVRNRSLPQNAFQNMDSSLQQPAMGKVLVVCESGNERSAAVCIAYMMDMVEEFDGVTAAQFCQAQRFCINIDDSMKGILGTYWDILQAKRMVEASGLGHNAQQLPQTGALVNGGKRSIDRAYEFEEEMETDEGREFTPFRDMADGS